MSVKIIGTTSAQEADVDTTPKALRTILYDSAGNVLQPTIVYEGISLINVRQSAATGAGAATWGIYNSHATRIVRIRSIWLQMFFDGTAAATLMRYELLKMTGINTFSGGALVTPSHKRTSLSGALVSATRVLDTGLTTTGGTAQQAMWNGVQGRVTQLTTAFSSLIAQPQIASPNGSLVATNVELAQNEALLLRQLVTSVVGDNVIGSCEFAEV